ncbi:hypothetical protein ACFY4I_39945, partial [Streptomyces scabiei]|uniref:hypothetical protein n=1 Tax=Streptomyces scabiei TaxID=1930 RepID=UPI0036874C84
MPPTSPDFGPDIDPYAASDPQRGCDPAAKQGVLAFRDLLLATYLGTTSLGISRECGAPGDSEHKEGRALDWGVNVNGQAHIAADLLDWLLATDRHGNTHALARRFGIMYMIWNRRIWEAYRADRGWTPYTGRSPHTNHVHFSFSWAGARKETTWWSRPTHSGPRVSVGVPSVVDTGSGMVIFGVDAGGGITHR